MGRLARFLIIAGLCMSLSPGAVLPRDMNMRQFSEWARAQQALPQRDVRRFTPTWNGFSVDPTAEMEYAILGSLAVIWIADNNGTGTSDDQAFSIEGIPDVLAPSQNKFVQVVAVDDGENVSAMAGIDTTGADPVRIIMNRGVVSGTKLTYATTLSWTNTGTKGLPWGWMVIYSLDN